MYLSSFPVIFLKKADFNTPHAIHSLKKFHARRSLFQYVPDVLAQPTPNFVIVFEKRVNLIHPAQPNFSKNSVRSVPFFYEPGTTVPVGTRLGL